MRRDLLQPQVIVPPDLWRSTFGFLLMATIWPRWLLFSGSLIAVLGVLAIGARLTMMADTGSGYSGIGPWILGMIFASIAVAGVILWLVLFAVHATAITVETAAGIDSIEDWPDGPMQDWMLDALYVILGLLLSGTPGALLARWLIEPGWPTGPWFMVSLLLLFPIVFLSMLECGSAIRPLSGPILRSLKWNWLAWILFSIASAAILATSIPLAMLFFWVLGLWGTVPAVLILVGATLIYFRLLGRLGMACGGLRS